MNNHRTKLDPGMPVQSPAQLMRHHTPACAATPTSPIACAAAPTCAATCAATPTCAVTLPVTCAATLTCTAPPTCAATPTYMTTQMNGMPLDLSQSVFQVQTPRHPSHLLSCTF